MIAVARERFGRQGYASTGIEELAADADVTTGALYHHFGNKQGLFREVVESIEAELLRRAAVRAAGASDAWEGFRQGIEETLDACQAEDVQRIVMVDGPTVLGATTWREIEDAYAVGALRSMVKALMDSGVIAAGSAEMVTRMLLSSVTELARVVARTAKRDRAAAREQATQLVARMLDALRIDDGG